MTREGPGVDVRVERPRCPYCHTDVTLEAAKAACESCMAWHHGECWDSHGGCATCGGRTDGQAAASRARSALEEPSVAVAPAAVSPFRCLRPGCGQPLVELERQLCREHAIDWAGRCQLVTMALVPACLIAAWQLGWSGLGGLGWALSGSSLLFAVVLAALAVSARANVRKWRAGD